jgi:hypothetical protein
MDGSKELEASNANTTKRLFLRLASPWNRLFHEFGNKENMDATAHSMGGTVFCVNIGYTRYERGHRHILLADSMA